MTDDQNNKPFKEWYSRGYLPHRDHYGLLQSITFRLNDSLPKETLLRLKDELDKIPLEKQDLIRRKRLDDWLDAGYGCCALGKPDMAKVMESSLLLFDGKKYRLISWCIMPNHVHVLIEPLISLSKIVQSWKAYTGKWAIQNGYNCGNNLRSNPGFAEDPSALSMKDKFLRSNAPRTQEHPQGNQENKFWMSGYWDRYIRDKKHFNAVVEYIHNNPVKANLCEEASNWQWSSAKEFEKD
jgi:type I restriction enzyme R subunit/putative DNA methylase